MFEVINLSASISWQCPSVIVTATLLNKQDREKYHIELVLRKTVDCGYIPTPLSVYRWSSLIDIVNEILVRNRLLHSLKGVVGSDEHK